MAGILNNKQNGKQPMDLHRIEFDEKEGMIVDSALKPLIDEKSGYIVLGRSISAHRKWRRKGLLQIGAVGELQETGERLFGREVFIDAAFPHIIFICGKRGSGKSYTLGIFAEELIRSAIGVGVILVDPIGIFWSLKTENSSRSEKRTLEKWGLTPTSFPEVKVLAPGTDSSVLPTNCDGPFSIGISEMTAEDWCQVFDMDRFKTQGLLVGTSIDQVRSGYRAIIDEVTVSIPGRPDHFSMGDIIQCIETSSTITSKTGGYNPQTRRSVIARFSAAAGWGIFSIQGTPLRELTSPNRVTVLDVSDTNLGDSKRSLITGIIARKILEGRIQTARIEENHEFDETDPSMIPLTWLLIDEAHIILPHNKQTPASDALIEFAKQGRKPGCALILATQRPASTSDEILSQVDILLGHNLALEDDMTALRRRVPAKLPPEFAVSDFIRGIPVGTAIVADQKTQQRSFLIKLRPRLSHHAGSSAMPKAFHDKRKRKRQSVPLTGAYIPKDMPSVLDPTPIPRQLTEMDEEIEGPASQIIDFGDIPERLDLIPEDPLPDLPWGSTILLKERSDEDLEMFLGNIEGVLGYMLLSPEHPSIYSVPTGPSRIDRWLSANDSKDALDPIDLGRITEEVHGSIGEIGSWVILIDGFEHLLRTSDPIRVKEFLEDLHEKVYHGKNLLVIRTKEPIDGTVLNDLFAGLQNANEPKSFKTASKEGKVDKDDHHLNGSLTTQELRWMCGIMGLPADGSENDLLNRLLQSDPNLLDDPGSEKGRMDVLKQIMHESTRAREENERLRNRIEELESEAGVDVPVQRSERPMTVGRPQRPDKRLVLVWEDEEEQKDLVEELIHEVEDLREEMDTDVMEKGPMDPEDTLFSRLMKELEEDKLENRERLTRLEEILQGEMDSLRDELGEQRKHLQASRKNVKLRVVKHKEQEIEPEKGKVLKKRVLKRGEEIAAVTPKIGASTALDIARRNLKRSLLKGPKEMIDEITPCYIPLYRFLVHYKGGMLKGLKESDVFIDSITGEIVEQGRTGLRRSEGLMELLKVTELEMDILHVLTRPPREPAWISKTSGIDLARTKRSLASLEKKGLVQRVRREANLDLYSMAATIVLPSRPWSKDHGFQPEFVSGIEEKLHKPRLSEKDAKILLERLSKEIRIMEQDIVRYPLYVVKIRGEGRTRFIAIDGVGGRLDRRITTLLKGMGDTGN